MPFEIDKHGNRRYTVIPTSCLALLPLKSEAFTRWGRRSDLAEFRYRYQEEGDVGERTWADNPGNSNCSGHITSLADELTSGSSHTYHERHLGKIQPVNYRRDVAFGGFAKAWEVWDRVEQELLSEGGFFSIAHTLEAKTDIDCALVLIKHFFYRQAFICLRTFLEEVMFPLYYLHHPGEFEKWRVGTNNHLSMRAKKDGVLARLVNLNVIDTSFAKRVGQAYGEHNPAVHGHAEDIINTGTFDKNWQGLSFKRAELHDWLIKAKECLEIGLIVVKLTSDQWLDLTRAGSVVCRICHSTDFSIKPYPSKLAKDLEISIGNRMIKISAPTGPSQRLFIYRCRSCGKTIHSSRTRRENEALKPLAP